MCLPCVWGTAMNIDFASASRFPCALDLLGLGAPYLCVFFSLSVCERECECECLCVCTGHTQDPEFQQVQGAWRPVGACALYMSKYIYIFIYLDVQS